MGVHMGGTVAVTVKKDGVLKKMARKTGSYSSMLFSNEMLNGNVDQALSNYFKIFDEMRDDFKQGSLSGHYELPMSAVYGGYEFFAPSGYGLVFIDFDTKQIHSMQGYDSPGMFSAIEVKLERFHKSNPHGFKEDYCLEKFMQEGKVNVVVYLSEEDHEFELDDFIQKCGIKSRDALIEVLIKEDNFLSFFKKKGLSLKLSQDKEVFVDSFNFSFSLKEFNLVKYDEDIDGCVSMFNQLKEYLNDEEVDIWRDFASDLLDDFEDEKLREMIDNDESEDLIDDYFNSKKEEFLSVFKKQTNKHKI